MLEYYLDHLKRLYPDWKYKEVSKEELLSSSFGIVNHHICINDLKRWQTIAIAYNKFYKHPVDKVIDEWSIIYTNIQNKTVVVSSQDNYFILSIYDDKLFVHSFTLEDLKSFLDWIDIDELTNKVRNAYEYIYAALLFTNGISYQTNTRNMSSNRYSDNSILNNVSAYIEILSKYTAFKKYDELFIYKDDGLYHKCFINCFEDKYSFDKKSKGSLRSILIYFPIDNRNVLVLRDEFAIDKLILVFLKQGKIYYVEYIRAISRIEVIFELINRKDISDFLKKIDMIHTDNWEGYVKNQPVRKIKYQIKQLIRKIKINPQLVKLNKYIDKLIDSYIN